MKRDAHEKKTPSDKRRTEFVTARITGPARHYLEVMARLHDESLSSVIQRAIIQMGMERIEHGGAWIGADQEDGGTQVARDTWAPEEWLRRLKLFLEYPSWTPAREAIFWGRICATKRYWGGRDHKRLSVEDKRRFVGAVINGPGIPNEAAIANAWEEFKASQLSKAA